MYLSQDQIQFIVDKTTADLTARRARGEIDVATYQDEIARLTTWTAEQQVPA